MRDKWKRRFQEELREDAKRIMEEVNSDPTLQDVDVPDEVYDKLMKQIREYEGEAVDTRLTAEEKELIQLGMVYKRTRRWNRYVVVAAAIVTALALGITSLGGPQKVIQVVREFVSERERTRVNVDQDRIDDVQAKGESEAFLEIEEKFDCEAVRLYYLPKGLDFSEAYLDESLQRAKLCYEGDNQLLMYNIWFNYRSTSTGVDVEDELVKEYILNVKGYDISLKQYQVESDDVARWRAEFEYQKVHYFIETNGIKQEEVEKIVKNLKFF